MRLRYRQRPLDCTVSQRDGDLTLALAAPAYGVAPGQLACLMDGEVIVGHATIAAAAAPERPARPAGGSPVGQLR